MKTVIVVGFWMLVAFLARVSWRFARRPTVRAEQSSRLVRAADAFTRDVAKAASYMCLFLLGLLGLWLIIIAGLTQLN
jgi:hypothetical protein